MVSSFNLPNLSISRPSTPSILSPSAPAATKTTSPLIQSSTTLVNGFEQEGRLLEKTISGGGEKEKEKKKGLGLTSTLNALLSNPSRNPTPIQTNTTSITTTQQTLSRPLSTGSTGILPLKHLHLSSSSPSKQRSQSAAPTCSRNGKALSSSTSSPLVSPTSPSQPSLSLLKSLLPGNNNNAITTTQTSAKPSSRRVSPIATPLGISTPLPNQSISRSSTPVLQNLEESYVSKVSFRLGESVNKVFVMNHTGPCVELNKMNAPKWLKAREVGELICSELETAQHDSYLLRTLLRSSVLKSLSLFLSRLTTLLLPATAYPNFDVNLLDSFPLPLKFNLEIVRSAYEVKEGLRTACSTNSNPFVSEILKPWILKYEELMNKVMGPIILGLRINLGSICARGREEESLEILVVASGIAGGGTKAVVGRSLSMGRSTTILPISSTIGEPSWIKELGNLLESSGKFLKRLECGRDSEKWLVNLGTCAVWKGMLSLSTRRNYIDASSSNSSSANQISAAQTSLVSVELVLPVTSSTSSLGGRSLFKSASHKTSPNLAPILASSSSSTSSSSNGSSPKQIDSKPLPTLLTSPKLQASTSLHTRAASSPSASSDLTFIRYLSDLELFESRLITFVASLSHPCPTPDILISGTCSAILNCGLCKTGRTFDAESSESDEEEEGTELAQCAMREAMQALSAMVIVVRASRETRLLKEVMEFTAGGGVGKVVEPNSMNSTITVVVQQEEELKPMTPSAFLTSSSLPSTTTITTSSPSSPTYSPCPTLIYALDTLPLLILLQLLISRLPPTLSFRQPHEIWETNYIEYARELRGFGAGENLVEEIGWELAGEITKVREERFAVVGGEGEGEKESLRLLGLAIRTRVGVEVGDI